MQIYFTYGEPPSGVYTGQVCDVVNFLQQELKMPVMLLAFISLHDYRENKNRIKAIVPGALVFPMLPKATYWRFNILWLWIFCLIYRPEAIIARNVIAANMALAVKSISSIKKVCFDGRGAIAAEWKEYDVSVPVQWKSEIKNLENKAVNSTDFRIAVTHQLVQYWKLNYGYSNQNHVVIPCTLSSNFISTDDGYDMRELMGYTNDDVVFVYSGSTAGWQSFSLLKEFLQPLLSSSPNNKVLFLAKEDANILQLAELFPGQVENKWLAHDKVMATLRSCDYGIMIREKSVTNRVASPTKFAEYLCCGLPVVISDHLGDYSEFVEKHQCGIKLTVSNIRYDFNRPSSAEKQRMKLLATAYFTKTANIDQYKKLAAELSL
jgi:hypothetical protein